MILHADPIVRSFLDQMNSGNIETIELDDSAVDVAEAEIVRQHPEEAHPRERAIARLAHMKYGMPDARSHHLDPVQAQDIRTQQEMLDVIRRDMRVVSPGLIEGAKDAANRVEAAMSEISKSNARLGETISTSNASLQGAFESFGHEFLLQSVKEVAMKERILKWSLGSFWAAFVLLLLLFVATHLHAQTTSVDIKRVGGTLVTSPLPVSATFTPSGTQDTNLKQIGGTNISGADVVDAGNTAFRVNCVVGCGASGFNDASAFTFGTTSVNNISAVVDDIGTNTVAENSAGVVRMNTNRILYVDLSQTAANVNKLLVTADPITFAAPQHVIVDSGSASVTQGTSPWVTSGTVTANQGSAGVSAWLVDGSGVTQPISGAISFTAPQHTILDSGTLTSITNKVGVTGADGDVFVRQTTGTNLHTVTDSGSVTAATLSAETTKVIGTVRTADGSGNLFTTSSTTYTAKNPLDTNLLGTLGTAFSTAGKVDVKSADGDTFVRSNAASTFPVNVGSWIGSTAPSVGSKTSANSVPVVIASDQGSVAVAATLSAETTKVIGTVRNLGNAGGVFDTTQNAAVPANALSVGCNFTTSPSTITTGNQGAVQCNSKGELLTQLTDGTTNVAVISGTTALKTDLSSVAGTATSTAASGVQKVGIVGNAGAAVDAATGAAPPANAILAGGLTSGATGGFVTAIPVCDSYVAVNISTATTTLIVTGVSGRHVRICSLNLLTAAANNVALISGTGATCGTGTAGMTGGTSAASGWNFAANGGIAIGSGIGTVIKTIATGDSVCVVTSASTQLSGGVSYTIY